MPGVGEAKASMAWAERQWAGVGVAAGGLVCVQAGAGAAQGELSAELERARWQAAAAAEEAQAARRAAAAEAEARQRAWEAERAGLQVRGWQAGR